MSTPGGTNPSQTKMPTTRTEPETLRTNDVLARLNVSRSSLHRRRQNGTFPKPSQLSKHAVGWRRADIDAWLADRPAQPIRRWRGRAPPRRHPAASRDPAR